MDRRDDYADAGDAAGAADAQLRLPVVARAVSLSRSGRVVLDDVSVSVGFGDIVGVLGLNGAGKTTLLETLLGFHVPDSGSIELFGCPVLELGGGLKRRIGFVPQRDELLDGLRGRDQVRLIASFYPDWDAELVDRLVGAWDLPLERPVRELSLGQRQKLSIILALAPHPELLVLDEPVASLDPLARRRFLEELTALACEQRRAILFSSHIVGDLQGLVNKVWMVDRGRIRWQGDATAFGNLEEGFREATG